ncbi:MAG: cytochrome c biogenesis protein [Bacteroidota bacterium]
MLKHWWKILGAVLMIYAIAAGMLVPLSPASHYVDNQRAETGQQLELTVTGYNTHYFSEEGAIRAWLRRDSAFSLCADNVSVLSERLLKLSFTIPARVYDKDEAVRFSLVVDNKKDGYSVLPEAVVVTQMPSRALIPPTCDIQDLNDGEYAFTFPFRNILEETIRNLYYHVPLWFAMILLFLISMIHSIRYLSSSELSHSIKAAEYVRVGVVYGLLGLLTGAIWAKHTWGSYWNWDLRQITAAIAMLIYLAYFVLRDSFDDEERKARLGAVFNIFAFAALIPLMFVIPRLSDSLHPGAGGNPAFGTNDLDNTMRMVFYPAIIGFMLVGVWMSQLLYRMALIKEKIIDRMD